MPVWEYHKSWDEEDLDALGREGWELVAVLPGEAGSSAILYFKRPAPDFREGVTQEQKVHYYKLMGIHGSSNGEGKKP